MAFATIDLTKGVTGGLPSANATYSTPRENAVPLIINGDMAVAQRSTSVTGHNAVSYTTVDRFKTVCEVGTYTVIQESLTSGNAYLNGFKNKAMSAINLPPLCCCKSIKLSRRCEI